MRGQSRFYDLRVPKGFYAGSTPSLPKSTADRRLKFGAHCDRPLRRWKRSRVPVTWRVWPC